MQNIMDSLIAPVPYGIVHIWMPKPLKIEFPMSNRNAAMVSLGPKFYIKHIFNI